MTFPFKYNELPTIVTPKGPAIWPKLNAPDFKFKTEHGEYSVKIRLNDAAAQKVIEKIEAFFPVALARELEVQARIAESKGKKAPKKQAAAKKGDTGPVEQ